MTRKLVVSALVVAAELSESLHVLLDLFFFFSISSLFMAFKYLLL